MSNIKLKNIVEEIKNLNEILDLNNKDSLNKWLENNGPDQIFDDDGNIDWDYTDPITGDDLETLIYTYTEKYNDVKKESTIEIYRLLKLKSIDDLNLKNVGVFWSFDKNGVGAYGVGKKFTGSNTFVLTAEINTKDIDWEQGFKSFLGYGKSEFECYMKKGSKCLLTYINDTKYKKPIDGIC